MKRKTSKEILAEAFREVAEGKPVDAITVEDDSFQLSWDATGDVSSYFVSVTDANGKTIGELNGTNQSSMAVRAADMIPGMVYTLRVGALPLNGGRDDIQWSTATFVRPVRETEPPAEQPTEKPGVGKPVINIGGSAYQKDGVTTVTGSSIIVSWSAEGSVDSYYVYVENAAGKRVTLGRTTETSRTVSTDRLPAGRYTVHVGVMAKGGRPEDALWSAYEFVVPAREADENPTAPPDEPVEGDVEVLDFDTAETADGEEDFGEDSFDPDAMEVDSVDEPLEGDDW